MYSIASCCFGNGIEGPSIGLPFGLISGSVYYLIQKNQTRDPIVKEAL